MLENYDEIIKAYKNENIIEKIETVGKTGLVHYLPHLAVIKNERETTKTHTVFDTSSKIGNTPSLNDCLQSSPYFLPLIFNILLRFRIGDVGLVADTKQAFLNIETEEKDRDLLRLLWVENISEKDKIVVYRFSRVVFEVTSSPFLLRAMIKCKICLLMMLQQVFTLWKKVYSFILNQKYV